MVWSVLSALTISLSTELTTSDITAIDADDDYTGTTDEVVSFGIGDHTKMVSIVIDDDESSEHDESFLLTLSDPMNGVVGDLYQVPVVIKDTDSAGTLSRNIVLCVYC